MQINWRFAGVVAPLAVGFLSGCGGDLTCGPGTTESGEQCLPSGAMVGSGGSGVTIDGGGVVDTPPTFSGITSVAPVSNSALQITWDPATDDTTDPENIVYRAYLASAAGEQNFGQYTGESPPGARALVVANLKPDTEYFIVVRAMDAAQQEDENATELSGTPVVDDEPPTFDGAVAADPDTSNSVTVSWEPASDDKTPPEGMSYTVRWSDKETGAMLGTVGILTAPGATSAIVANLPQPVTTYYFHVQARDAAGNVDANDVTVSGETGPDTTPPVFAGCASVAEPGATRATAGWDPARDDTTRPDDIVYNVYAFEDPVDEGTPFGAPMGSFVGGDVGIVDGLNPKTVYYLVCRAQDSSGNEDQNIAFRQILTKDDSEPPTFDGIVGATPDSTSAELNWAAASDDQTLVEEIVYLVYQSTEADPVNTGTLITPGPVPGATNFTVTGLTSRTPYFWAVLASDRAGNVDANDAVLTKTTLVSFADDVQPIFSTNCAKSQCHLGEEAMQGMRLEEGYAHLHTVGAKTVWPTENNPHFGKRINRIEPGNTFLSFLYHKINHTAELAGTDTSYDPPKIWGFGSGMPKDIFPAKLPQVDRDTIEGWIEEGARDN